MPRSLFFLIFSRDGSILIELDLLFVFLSLTDPIVLSESPLDWTPFAKSKIELIALLAKT